MYKTYKFKLYPSDNQRILINKVLGFKHMENRSCSIYEGGIYEQCE